MIYLNYQNYKLGSLDYKNEQFIYNSLEGEKSALENCVGLIDYDLKDSKNKTQKELFLFFVNNFIDVVKNREDIIEKNIFNSQNYYEILKILSKMKLDRFGFWLSN